ncbi:MAG: hypothetical protein K8R79_01730, partial [Calditrichales bacterium]|nr:hypothetical protein [Calditrichales bacterium]
LAHINGVMVFINNPLFHSCFSYKLSCSVEGNKTMKIATPTRDPFSEGTPVAREKALSILKLIVS